MQAQPAPPACCWRRACRLSCWSAGEQRRAGGLWQGLAAAGWVGAAAQLATPHVHDAAGRTLYAPHALAPRQGTRHGHKKHMRARRARRARSAAARERRRVRRWRQGGGAAGGAGPVSLRQPAGPHFRLGSIHGAQGLALQALAGGREAGRASVEGRWGGSGPIPRRAVRSHDLSASGDGPRGPLQEPGGPIGRRAVVRPPRPPAAAGMGCAHPGAAAGPPAAARKAVFRCSPRAAPLSVLLAMPGEVQTYGQCGDTSWALGRCSRPAPLAPWGRAVRRRRALPPMRCTQQGGRGLSSMLMCSTACTCPVRLGRRRGATSVRAPHSQSAHASAAAASVQALLPHYGARHSSVPSQP